MATKRVLEDADFGKIIVSSRRGARNITMRTKPDGLHVTVPPYSLLSEVLKAIEPYREKLLVTFEAAKPTAVDADFRISAPCFKLRLERGLQKNFMLSFREDEVVLSYPPATDFSRKEVQTLLRNGIVRALKRKAAELLPPVLEMYASKYALHYKKVKITGAKSRWGSCSGAGTISLSCYLMLLPPHLSDYVLLHELAHTVEMNQGPRFWEKLNSMTDGQALQLRSELRKFQMPNF